MLAMPSEYEYSLTFVTVPELWSGEFSGVTDTAALPFAARVRFDQAAHPASKGVLIHAAHLGLARVAATYFVDGSASMMRRDAFVRAVPHPFGNSNTPFAPVLATRDGYMGRDR